MIHNNYIAIQQRTSKQIYQLQNMHTKIGSSIQLSQQTNQLSQVPKRIAFKLVKSTFQPPQQTQASYNYLHQQKSTSSNHTHKLNQILNAQKQGLLQFESNSFYSTGNNNNKFNANVQFIYSLIAIKEKQLVTFDEGDCIPIHSDDRWIVISGEVRVVGLNGCSYVRGEGYVFFASGESKRKIKQVVVISSTTAYRIPQQVFKQNIRNYLYIKNSQKIKFLQYCPFLSWNQSLSEDIAICMQHFQPPGKDTMIYKQGDQSDYIYFVKEGIVLLERTGKAGNRVIMDFQRHYETSYLGEEEGLIIVRKGMLFGADGVLIKEIGDKLAMGDNPEEDNKRDVRPYDQEVLLKRLKTTRIYNAKSIGKCQLYRIDKNILQTFLKSPQPTNPTPPPNQSPNQQPAQITTKQLDRICLEYTNLLMGASKSVKEVKKRNFQFKLAMDESIVEDMDRKRKKVEGIRMQEKKVKKVTHANGNANTGDQKKFEANKDMEEFPHVLSPKRRKIQSQSKKKQFKDVSLPSLNKKYVQSLIYKKLEAKEALQYINYKKKIQHALFGKDHKNQKQQYKLHKQNNKGLKKEQNANFMKVKSYRSILSSLS